MMFMRTWLLILCCAGAAWSGDPRTELAARAKSIRSAGADLVQSLHVMGQAVDMKGRVWFKAPGRFRVELELALGELHVGTLTVSDGRTLTIYQDLLQTVEKVDLTRLEGAGSAAGPEIQDPSDPFKGFAPDSIRSLSDAAVDGTACAVFEARLKEPARVGGMVEMDRARLWLGREDAFPRRMVLMDARGNEVMRQSYTNVRINPVVEDDLFVFVPPPGARSDDDTDAILDLLQGESPPSLP